MGNKNIVWIGLGVVGIILILMLLFGVFSDINLKLFAIQTGCISNEPITLEGYKIVCNWTIYNALLQKCEIVTPQLPSERLEITWAVPKQGEMEEDIQIWFKNRFFNAIPTYASNISKERTRLGIDIFSFSTQYGPSGEYLAKFYYFCSSKIVDYKTVKEFDSNIYYHINFDEQKGKCIYLRETTNSKCATEATYYPNGDFCESSDVGSLGECRVATAEQLGIVITKQDYVCLLYTDRLIEDKYFNTFYTCQECNDYYWFDDTNRECSKKQFCGTFLYKGLHTFATEDECKSALRPACPTHVVPPCSSGEKLESKTDAQGCPIYICVKKGFNYLDFIIPIAIILSIGILVYLSIRRIKLRNPFKMWGSWVGFIVILIPLISALILRESAPSLIHGCGEWCVKFLGSRFLGGIFVMLPILGGATFAYKIGFFGWILFFILYGGIGFLIGWVIESLIRGRK